VITFYLYQTHYQCFPDLASFQLIDNIWKDSFYPCYCHHWTLLNWYFWCHYLDRYYWYDFWSTSSTWHFYNINLLPKSCWVSSAYLPKISTCSSQSFFDYNFVYTSHLYSSTYNPCCIYHFFILLFLYHP